jgi:excisionase family DNA binding protein
VTGRLLTARELAEMLAVSPETILRWYRRGELPAIRLPGGAIRFRESEIERRLEGWATNRPPATGPARCRPDASTMHTS